MTKHYSKILNMTNSLRKIYKTSHEKSKLYKYSFTSKYLVQSNNEKYYTPKEIILKNRSLSNILK